MESLAIRPTLAVPDFQPVALRFLWKECRVLRGLAIGVVVLAVLEMAVSLILLSGSGRTAWMLVSAFGATALFTIGATVMLFAAERDDGTKALLQLLPQQRVAALAGKLLAAFGMSLAVLAVLCLAGTVIAGWRIPDLATTRLIVSQGFMALAEAFAWGLFVSLLCPNALLAAVLGMAAASFNSQLAIALTVADGRGFSIDDFQAALPGRLAIVAAVFAVDIWLGLRWLAPSLAPARRAGRTWARSPAADVPAQIANPRRLSMFARLVWQSMRQSWKTALVAIAIGAFLMFSVETIIDLLLRSLRPRDPLRLPLTLLFIPALFGALVFRADQRARQYRFLAEHAARPRMVWLARQFAWFLPFILVCLAVHAALWWYIGRDLYDGLRQSGEAYEYAMSRVTGIPYVLDASLLAWLAALAAYAVGQFFSLALRSDVLAALLSLGSSVLILIWAYALFAWQLPALLFLLPLVIGAFLATWQRAKSWLFERPGIGRWALPIVAIVLPFALAMFYMPVVRFLQLKFPYPASNFDSASLQSLVNEAAKELELGRKVADDHARIASRLDDLARRNSALTDEDLRSLRQFSSAELDEEILRLSRVHCRIPIVTEKNDRNSERAGAIAGFARSRARYLRGTDLDTALELLLASRRITAQVARGQVPARNYWLNQSFAETIEPLFVEWATTPGQTRERVRRAIDGLREIDRQWPNPGDLVVNQYLRSIAVVRGDSPPSFMEQEKPDMRKWLAYLANNLSGESARGEKALGVLAAAALDYIHAAGGPDLALEPRWERLWRDNLRKGPFIAYKHKNVLLPALTAQQVWGTSTIELQAQLKVFGAARTSYLAADEFAVTNALVTAVVNWVSDVARHRAEIVRLALIAYHLENGEYPASLGELAPSFLTAAELRDPFTTVPFGYKREGFPVWFAQLYFYDNGPAPPNTPVLWSIGEAACKPVEREMFMEFDEAGNPVRVVYDPDREGRSENSEIRKVPVMIMEPTESGGDRWHGWGSFWLPLPTKFPEAG
jgi:hypothetical protein